MSRPVYAFRDLSQQSLAARQLGPTARGDSREGGQRGRSLPPLEHLNHVPKPSNNTPMPGEDSTSTIASLTFVVGRDQAAAPPATSTEASLNEHLNTALTLLRTRRDEHRTLLSAAERDLVDNIRTLIDADPDSASAVERESASSRSSKQAKRSDSSDNPTMQPSFTLSSGGSFGDFSIRHLKRGDSISGLKKLTSADLKGYVCDLARNSFRITSEGTAYVVPVEVDAAVLFIDITGYSALTTAMESKGAYELSRIVNRVFTTLVQACVDLFLGDVAKFAGDAIVVVWPAGENLQLEECCLRAASCALYLQTNHPTFEVPGTEVKLSMHIGLSAGPLRSIVLQGHQLQHTQTNWHLLSGAPLNDIGEAADAAKPGEVVMTEAAWRVWPQKSVEAQNFYLQCLASPAVAHAATTDSSHGKLYKVTSRNLEAVSPVSATVPKQGATFDGQSDDEEAQLQPERAALPDDYNLHDEQKNLEGFIHTTILRRIEAQMPPDHMSEMRLLGVMFIHLTTPLDDISTWFIEVLSILDTCRCGTVQIIDDDKGLHVIAAANLHTAVREPGKAVADACAELVARRLGVTVGAAVGVVFCGLVGCDQARRWDITGAACVRACRLMQHGIAANIPVVLDSTVLDNVTDLSVLRPLSAPITVKGTPTPVVVHTLDASRNTAITLMPAFRSVTEAAVHSQVSHALSMLIADRTHQRVGAIISGPPGVGKAYLCHVALKNTSSSSSDRFVTISLPCVPGDKMQLLRTIAVWFSQHCVPDLRKHANDLHDALSVGHIHRATLTCIATVEAALYYNYSLAIIVSQGQYLDMYSLSVLQQLLTADPSPGRGRFAAFVTVVPEVGMMTDAAIATKLTGRGFTPFRRRVGALDDVEAGALVTRRLGWTASDRVRRVVKALSGNIPVCIDHTIAMIQRQRPYITHLRSDGVVDADDAAIDRIITKTWQEISPALCARLQQNYDTLEPRLQRLLKAIATLDNRAFAPPVVLVAAAVAEFDPKGVALIGKDLHTLEELHMISIHGPASASDYYGGDAEDDQLKVLRADIVWPSHIALSAESQKHAERLRTSCVSFSNPAFRDTVRAVIVPPQRRGFLRVALHYAPTALHNESPIMSLFTASWVAQLAGPDVNEAIAELLTPALQRLRSPTPNDALSMHPSTVAVTKAVIIKLLAAHNTPATASPLVTAVAPSLMPMVVVFVKNFQPSSRLSLAIGPLLDLCRICKDIAIDAGNQRVVDRQTTLAALAALTAIDRVLCQYTRFLESKQLRSDEFVSYHADDPSTSRDARSPHPPVADGSHRPKSRRASSHLTSTAWRHPSVVPLGERLARVTDPTAPPSFDAAMDLVNGVWQWLEKTIVPLHEPIGEWVRDRQTVPPEPTDAWINDLRQRGVLERAFDHLCTENNFPITEAAVQKAILLLTSCAWDSGHPLVNVAMFRDLIVFRRVATPLCLKAFLYMSLILSR